MALKWSVLYLLPRTSTAQFFAVFLRVFASIRRHRKPPGFVSNRLSRDGYSRFRGFAGFLWENGPPDSHRHRQNQFRLSGDLDPPEVLVDYPDLLVLSRSHSSERPETPFRPYTLPTPVIRLEIVFEPGAHPGS